MTDEDQISELLFQIQRDIEDMEREIKDKEKNASGVEKEVLERERNAVKDAKQAVVSRMSKLNHGVWLTECCDAPIRRYALNTRGVCSECGEDNPETYNVEKSVEDLIEEDTENAE